MTPNRSAALVADLVARNPMRPLLLALDGPGGAGTTTLAGLLADRLGASVVHGDDFYRDMPDQRRWELGAVEGFEQYFDWQRLRREALEPLKAGRSTRYRPYGWRPEGGLAQEWTVVPASGVVVVEGVYVARPELADLVDLAVLVDTPAGERLRRMTARGHGNEAWIPHWSAAEEHYFSTVRLPGSFDLVVPGA